MVVKSDFMNNTVLYSENQRFKQLWLWGFMIILNGIFIVSAYQQLYRGIPFGNKPMSDEGIIIGLFSCMLIATIFLVFKLKTTITKEHIQVQFFPFHLKPRTYLWTDIKQASVRKYRPIMEYGGWGIRGFKSNRAYNVSGKIGLQLEFKNGDKLLVGTQNGQEVNDVLVHLFKK